MYWHFRSKTGVLEAMLQRPAEHYLGEFGVPDTAGFAETASDNFHFLMVLGCARVGPPS